VADYLTPLPQLLADTLEAGVNQVLALDPESARRLEKLDNRFLQLDLEGLGITLYLTAESGTVLISLSLEGEPDTVISGTPFALFAMAAPGDDAGWDLPGTRVRITGDATLARDMERVFSRLNPDWERPLAALFGDVIGYQLFTGLRQGVESLREAAQSTAEMAGAYLRDEAEALVRPFEMKSFGDDVEKLRDAVDRLEARLRTLRETRK
jgi:ubiquinone biosynthesis protein UbiJ